MNLKPELNRANVVDRAWIDTYEGIAPKAQLVRDVLQKRNVRLGNSSALSQLLNQADRQGNGHPRVPTARKRSAQARIWESGP